MNMNEALSALDFGSVNSESEEDLDRLFVRTTDFDKFLKKNVWITLGAKGTGKSALFELFTKFEESTRRMSGDSLQKTIIAAGTGFGDLSEIATGDLQHLKDGAENYDHDRMWRLYIAVKAGLAVGAAGLKVRRGPLRQLLTGIGEKRDFRVGPLLKELWTLAIGTAPSEVTVSTGGASLKLNGGKGTLDTVTLLQDVHAALVDSDASLWLMFDKVDELWPSDRNERKKSIEGLMTACMHIRRTFPAIQPKVFLRTDLWGELDFTNKDHLTDKRIELNWTTAHLSSLLLKRATKNNAVMQCICARHAELDGRPVDTWTPDEKLAALQVVFPATAYPGDREAAIVDWLVERVRDGRGTVLPRDAIVLANSAADLQREVGSMDSGTLIGREAIRQAFTRTSQIRCESYLAEFPDLREHFRRFSGQTTSEFSRQELLDLMGGLSPLGDELLERLFEIGVLRPDSGRVVTARSYEVPRLYRTGLGLVIRGRP